MIVPQFTTTPTPINRPFKTFEKSFSQSPKPFPNKVLPGTLLFKGETNFGKPPLAWPIIYRDLPKIKALLDGGENVNTPVAAVPFNSFCNHSEEVGWTPLMYAVGWEKSPLQDPEGLQKRKAVVELLLQVGANVQLKNQKNQTALILLAANQDPDSAEIATALLKAGANQSINAQDDQGNTALHYAALNGKAETVKVLLKAGADKTLQNQEGKTPLMMLKNYALISLLSTSNLPFSAYWCGH